MAFVLASKYLNYSSGRAGFTTDFNVRSKYCDFWSNIIDIY